MSDQPTTTAEDPQLHAEAWAFVMRHHDMMQRMAHRFAGRLKGDERREWFDDVMIRIVERFHTYDPSRSQPVTWIGWQMRAVTTTYTRRFARRCREVSSRMDVPDVLIAIPVSPGGYGSRDQAERVEQHEDAAAQVGALYAEATPEQRIAIRSLLAGMTVKELRRRHGITGAERDEHLRALGARLEADTVIAQATQEDRAVIQSLLAGKAAGAREHSCRMTGAQRYEYLRALRAHLEA